MSFTGISEAVEAGSSLINNIINHFIPDKSQEEKDQAAAALQQMMIASQQVSAQTDIDKIEAASTNVFVAGWRPFVGWVCGVGFGIQVLGPLLEWVAALAGHAIKFPVMDGSLLGSTLSALLGLGMMRSWDKKNGVSSGH